MQRLFFFLRRKQNRIQIQRYGTIYMKIRGDRIVRFKEKFKKTFWNLILVIGIGLCIYSPVSSFISHKTMYDAVNTYQQQMKQTDDTSSEEMLNKARQYNEALYKMQKGEYTENVEILSKQSYRSMLSINGSNVIATISIPKINVDIPVRHGISEKVLQSGAGHIQQSSLPIGGKNTRAVISGHRGLPTAKLFTRLDEIKKGDMFFISVVDKTLAYKVSKIETVLPEDVESIKPIEGEDLVTLVTCTPYGVNDHRLLVTGKRTKYIPEQKEAIKSKLPSIREIAFILVLPVLMILSFLIRKIKAKKKAKLKADKKPSQKSSQNMSFNRNMYRNKTSDFKKISNRKKR